MPRRHYYLLCALPALKDLGSPPPLKKSEFVTLVHECGGPESKVQALLLSDDLLQREAVFCNEIEVGEGDFACLTVSQALGDQPLPWFLISEGFDEEAVPADMPPVDMIWRRYFFHVDTVARRLGSPLLARWVGHEVGLRNALARARADALSLDPRPYLVAEELGDPASAFDRELDDWKRAPHPLAGLEVLEKHRWDWLTDQEPWYDFGDDEVVAYSAKLMVLVRRQRMFRDNV